MAASPAFTATGNRRGLTVGGGLEYMFAPNWSAKVEYQYYNFGNTTFTAGPGPPGTGFATTSTVRPAEYRWLGGRSLQTLIEGSTQPHHPGRFCAGLFLVSRLVGSYGTRARMAAMQK